MNRHKISKTIFQNYGERRIRVYISAFFGREEEGGGHNTRRVNRLNKKLSLMKKFISRGKVIKTSPPNI